MSDKIVHQGRAVRRLREILGKEQKDLAIGLGVTQQAISLLEGKETIDPKMLSDVAKVLNIPADAIKNFDEDAAVNIISNTFTDFKDNASAINSNCNLTFNPVDKIVELYERMIKERDEIIAKLQQDKK